MTTIACDRRTMAADTRMTSDGGAFAHTQKLFRLNDGSLFGFSGDPAVGLLWVQYLDGEIDAIDDKKVDDDASCALRLTPSGIWLYQLPFYCTPVPVLDHYAAIGSGEMAAQAALILGHEPHDAIAIAAKVDAFTGGPIIVETLYE